MGRLRTGVGELCGLCTRSKGSVLLSAVGRGGHRLLLLGRRCSVRRRDRSSIGRLSFVLRRITDVGTA